MRITRTGAGLMLAGAMLAAAPAAAQDMTGPRIELQAGWDKADFDVSVSDSSGNASATPTEKGIVFGVEAGYDVALDSSRSILFGVLAGYALSTADRCDPLLGNDSACLKPGREIELGGRLSAMVGERSLVYLKASYVHSRLRFTYEHSLNLIPDLSSHQDRGGVRFGAGFETLVSDQLYAKLEYRFTDTKPFGQSSATFVSENDITRHQVVAGAGLRF